MTRRIASLYLPHWPTDRLRRSGAKAPPGGGTTDGPLATAMPAKRDIQTLFRTVRDQLGLDPKGEFRNEGAEDVRTTLGGLAACIHGIGSLRTHGGDAHGRERGHARHIDARIARLAIHSAGAAALFLIETWQFRHPAIELQERPAAGAN